MNIKELNKTKFYVCSPPRAVKWLKSKQSTGAENLAYNIFYVGPVTLSYICADPGINHYEGVRMDFPFNVNISWPGDMGKEDSFILCSESFEKLLFDGSIIPI